MYHVCFSSIVMQSAVSPFFQAQRSAAPKGGTSTTPVPSRNTGVRSFSLCVKRASAKRLLSVLVQPRPKGR